MGWAENLRPFADPQPLVLALPALATTLLLVSAASLAARRDIGRGLIPAHDRAVPRQFLLGSPAALALRSELGVLVVWALGMGTVAFITGVISDAVTSGLTG